MGDSSEHNTALWLLCLLLLAPFGLRAHGDDAPRPEAVEKPPSRHLALSELLEQVLANGELEALYQRADVIVATIPDPDAGALGLLADQAIDAISSSAVRAGYLVGAHELPWKNQNQSEAREQPAPAADDADEGGEHALPDRTAYDQKLGALLFRREQGAESQWLIVLLVAESPLGGIAGAALSDALKYAGCKDAGAKLHVLGPAFSGSARALFRTLNTCAADARILTGAATGTLGEQMLKPRHAFGRTIVPDSQMLQFLLDELRAQHDIAVDGAPQPAPDSADERAPEPVAPSARASGRVPPRVRVAILSEAGTGYAAGLQALPAAHSRDLLRVLPYQLPLHLAELRSKHATQSPQQLPAAISRLRRGLRFDLAAYDGTRTDHVPAFSSLTAPGVDMTLRTLLQDVARREADYLVLVATDPADVYFLAGEARVYAPMTQTVILGGSLLYAHPEASSALSGVLMLSSYPLHLEFQRGQFAYERKLFDSDTAEGVFNALQWLIADLDRQHPERSLRFAPVDYEPRPGERAGPRPWLTRISNSRMWPLRRGRTSVISDAHANRIDPARAPDPPSLPSQPGTETTLSAATAQAHGAHAAAAPPQRIRVSPLGAGAGLLALAVSMCQLIMFGFARWGPHSHDIAYVRAFAAPLRNRLATTQYQMTTYLALALFGILASILAQRVYSWEQLSRNALTHHWGRASCGLLLAWLLPAVSVALFGCALWVFIDWLRRPHEPDGQDYRVYLTFVPLGALVAVALSCANELRTSLLAADAPLLLIRLTDPLGPCPLILLFCLGLGLYLWAVTGLSRASACARFPAEAPIHLGIELGPRLCDVFDANPLTRVRERLRNATLVTLAGSAGLTLWVVSSLRPTFEWRGYDLLIKLMLATLSGTVAFACLQAYLLWGVMREILVEHAALPVADAYARIASKVTQSFGVQLRSHVPPPRELGFSRRSLTLLIGLAKQIEADIARPSAPAAAGPSPAEPHPTAHVIVRARPAIERRLEQLQHAYDAPESASLERSGQGFSPAETEAVHHAFFAAADELYDALRVVWLERVRTPMLPADAEALEAWLPGGALASVPAALVIANSVPYNCRMWTRAAEDFVAMRMTTYFYFIINQIRLSLSFAVLGALLLLTGVFAYPLQPQHFAAMYAGFVLILAMCTALRVMLGMQRNELLRRLTALSTGALNLNLLRQIVTYAAAPSAVLLARVFPTLGDAIARAVEPVMAFLR